MAEPFFKKGADLLYFISIHWNVIKGFAPVLQALSVLTGLIVGGYWTYRLFIQNRQKYPRANLDHKIFHVKLPNDKIYLQVKVIVNNIGNVLICSDYVFTLLSQILPLTENIDNFDNSKREIEWPMLDKKLTTYEKKNCEIEPGESDEICFDFLINHDVELINIYSYFSNIKKKSKFFGLFKKGRDIGWPLTTIYNLKGESNV